MARSCAKSTSVQTLLYSCKGVSVATCRKRARAWAKKHGFTAQKVECKSGETCRVRQTTPGRFCKGTFRTITLSKRSGVKAVIGKRKMRKTPRKKR